MRVFALTAAVVGCSSAGGGGCNGGKGAANLVFTDENNYHYFGELAIDAVEIQPESDATVDWSGVTVDIRGYDLAAADVTQLAVLGVTENLATTIDLIEKNELDATQDAYLFDNAGGSSALLSEFNIIGAYLDIDFLVDDPEQTWIVSMLDVQNGITNLLMSTVFVPTTGSTETVIALDNDSASLAVDIDFHSAPAIVTTADSGPYSLDWTDVTVDVFGHEFEPLLGDQLMIGRYDTEDIGEVEAGFLQLDTNAVELYQVNVYGVTSVDLEDAVDDAGTAFPGFTTDGTWLVGVICTTCITPVPLLLSIVDVQ